LHFLFISAEAKFRSPSAAAALVKPTSELEKTKTLRRRSRSVASLFFYSQHEVADDGITSGNSLLHFLLFSALTVFIGQQEGHSVIQH